MSEGESGAGAAIEDRPPRPQEPGPDRPPRRVWMAVGLAAIGLAAVALRVVAYLLDKSIWQDEGSLAINVLSRDWAGLLKPLDDNQGAPFGFLLAEKLVATLAGPSELALRLVPTLASLAALVLIARAGARLGAWAGGIALLLAGFAPGMVYYGAEIKQYMTDAAVALLVLDAALAAWDRGVSPRRGLVLGALGAAAVWVSHPSVFILAATGTTLFLGFLLRGRRREAAIVSAAGATWVASFAVEYVVQLRNLSQNEFLVQFWTRGYLPFPPRSMGDLTRYANLPHDILSVPFEDYSDSSVAHEISLLAAGLWLVGLIALAAEGRFAALAMLASPLAITAVVAMTGRYPISGRMILFLGGPILLTIAAGLAFLLRSASRPDRRIGVALLALTAFTLIEHEVRTMLKTSRHEGARDVLEWVARDWRDGDMLHLHWAVRRPFEYYRMTGLIPGLARIEPLPSDRPPAVSPRGRTWTVFDRHATLAQFVPVEQTAHDLDRTGRLISERRSSTAVGLLHEPR